MTRHIASGRLALMGLATALACMGLAGCTPGENELRDWMEQERRNAKPDVPPLTPPKKFNPEQYAGGDKVEPFSSQKLSVALKQEAKQVNSLLAGELNRRKEPLENFPLDSMAMVGSVYREGRQFGLLKVDNLLYHVKVGDHIGQNYGRIMKISETDIGLREIVQDAAGEWVERNTNLQLQEKGR
jgi:type IV pilus assembly protein PilP